ncbi:MAG: hypothetical protein FWE63_04260 [Bacteroidales bacterium]|nr:hypothetical protein [Bacteroidales bacterium]
MIFRKIDSRLHFKLIIIAVIAIMIVFLLPLIANGFSGNGIYQLLTDTSKGFTSAWGRTLLFAFLSTIINTVGGLCLALSLQRISFESKLGQQLSLFILPVTLGNIAIAYIFKVSLYGTSLFDAIIQSGYFTQTIAMLFIQFWQYGFLFAYLFWISIQNIPKRINDYSIAVKHTNNERTKDIILPNIKNLFILLFFIGFIFSFYENAKNQFIFKASQGMNTELISQALHRIYKSNSIVNPTFANQFIFEVGTLITISVLFALVCAGFSIFLIFRHISKRKRLKNTALKMSKKNIFVAVVGLITVIAPIIIALLKSRYNFSVDALSELLLPLGLTLLSAFFATMLAILFGMASRLVFTKWLASFNTKTMYYFLIVFLLQIIPPICIIACGYQWLSWIGYNSFVIYLVWILGHSILVFPILGSFVLVTHFAVKENELSWLAVHHIPAKDISLYSFLKRFRAEYILTLLFAFTFIWNDTTLNKILSDKIPSFADNLQRLFSGRATDDTKAILFTLVAVIISISCVLLWQFIVRKSIKNNKI